MTEILIKNFKQISKADTEIAGGKGASLGEMTQAGIPVPEGFVILANTFDRFIEETDLNVEIDAVLDTVDIKEVHTVDNASEKIQAMILSGEMPQDIKTEILKNYKKLDCKFVAVRSSATSEDSASAAWAGQLDSFLNTTKDTLLENVKKCWASLFTPRAIFYRFEKKLNKDKISVAVVVQKMVDSEESGIAFSVHPITQDENQIIIEADFGLGEAIVSGSITPDSYVVDKQGFSILDINVNEQTKALYKKAKGGNEWKELGEKGKKQVLAEEKIVELSKLIVKIENHYGFPCDIEWAREKKKFYITQSRPITSLSDKKKENEGYENINWYYVINRPRCPLINSLMYTGLINKYEDQIPIDYLQKNIAVVKGIWYGDEDRDNYIKKQITNYLESNPDLFFQIIDGQIKKWKIFEDKISKYNEIDFSKLSKKELAKFFKKITTFLLEWNSVNLWLLWLPEKPIENNIKDLIERKITEGIISPEKSHDYFLEFTKSSRKGFFEKEHDGLENIAKEIHKERLPLKDNKVSRMIKKHLNSFCWLVNLDFKSTFWDENDIRDRLMEITKEFATNKTGNTPRPIKQPDIEKLNLSQNEKKIIKLAGELVFYRTFRTDIQWKTGYYANTLFNEIAKRLNITFTDFHYLFYDEILHSLNNSFTIDQTHINKRKYSYVVLILDRKIQVYHDKDKINKITTYFNNLEKANNDKGFLKGDIANKGLVQGVVKIVRSASDIKKIKENDILVTTMTKPAYITAMKKASAFVTDEGGILCHAAIISREMNKPCIINTKNATKELKDNMMIEVNANKGLIKILKKK